MTQQQIDALKQSLISLINSKLADQSTITASEHRDVETAIVDAIFTDKSLKGDIKEIACNQQYINDNFEPSSNTIEEGKAFTTSERFGWAICNGKNGTINKMGKVAIGYDPINYPLFSVAGTNVGGEKTHTLSVSEMPVHSHLFPGDDMVSNANNIGGWTNRTVANWNYDASSTLSGGGKIYKTSDTGGDQPHNNMQPYIVTLFIQKIS